MTTTVALITRIDSWGYYARFCYKNPVDAAIALSTWDGLGYPPGPWIKQKGPIERHHPLLYTLLGPHHAVRNDSPLDVTWEPPVGPQRVEWL